MYKLLPDTTKAKAEKEYSLRRLCVELSLLSVLLLFATVALLPSVVVIKEKRDAAIFALSKVEAPSRNVDKSALEKWVTRTDQEIKAIAPVKMEEQPYEYFLKLLIAKPEGVRVTGLSWQKPSAALTMRVTGVARDRQSLLDYQSSLLESGDWSRADFPVGALARETEIAFEMSLTPKKK